MKKILFAMAMAFATIGAWAQIDINFEADGIAYAVYGRNNPYREATVVARTDRYTGDIVIPPSVAYNDVTYTVTGIGEEAFYYNDELASITFPATITAVGSRAFSGCDSMDAVHIADLRAWCLIDFSDNPLKYAHNLYVDGQIVSHLELPAELTEVKAMAFYGADCITSITFPATIKRIGQGAFAMCTGLTEIDLPEPLAEIGNMAFNGDASLCRVSLPATLTSIGTMAFASCTSLSSMSSAVQYGTAVTSGLSPFWGSPTVSGTLCIPQGSRASYPNRAPWAEWGTITELARCEEPVITLSGNTLAFDCATPDATISATVTSPDLGTYDISLPGEQQLSGQYTVSAYATAPGMLASNTAKAIVVWKFTASDTPTGVGTTERDTTLLIQHVGNALTIRGIRAGESVSIVGIDGRVLWHSIATADTISIADTLPSIVIIKVGNKTYKARL